MMRHMYARVAVRFLRLAFSTAFVAVLVVIYLTVFTRGGIWS